MIFGVMSAYESDIALLAIGAICLQLLALGAALEAVLKSRTAPGAIAWSLSLVFFPLLMLPAYWIFGRRKFKGYARARQRGTTGISDVARRLHGELRIHGVALEDHALRAVTRLAQMPMTGGNHVDLLHNGDDFWKAIEIAIRGARQYVLLEFYILRDDDIGCALRDLLLEKAAEGVEIHFLYDEIGSFQLGRSYLDSLRRAGVDIRSFHTTKGRSNRFQINFRNHRKIVIVDGKVGITGGSNIGDEYLGKDSELSPWRDTNLLLRGPAVQCLQLAFLEDWFWACDKVPKLNWDAEAAGDVCTAIVASGPADKLETCVLFFTQLIQMAERRLWIVSPYFVPDGAIISALQLAALRGVDVRLMLPDKADSRMVQLSSYANMDDIQRAGVRVFRYREGFLHQKVWLVDDATAVVGTANLDNRSFRLNFEISVLVRNERFAREVERMLEQDFANSSEIEPGIFERASLPFRLAVRLSYMLAPIQ